MKTIIILGALVLSAGSYAQVRSVEKQVGTTQTELKQQGEKLQQEIKSKTDPINEQVSKIDRNAVSNGVKNEAQNLKDKATAATQDKKKVVESKIREGGGAMEAKAKAAAVKTEADADAMISKSKEDTKASVNSIDTKMTTARETLAAKLASKALTQTQFDEKMTKLKEFEERKNAIVKEME